MEEPLLYLLPAVEWGVSDVEGLGQSPREFKVLAAKVLSAALVATALLCLAMPGVEGSWCLFGAKAALFFAFFSEFVRGFLHFFWPYSSHLVFSGMADNINARHHRAELALIAMITHQFGAANLLLGSMYAEPLLFPNPHNSSLVFALGITLAVRVVQNYQM
eukprot:CAMPEP_0172700962 /NCGR_PEP_ID=MMETSP1074-20121228/31287_1 /TAXON_ID=2916 /ORGANISM="Ceratium fusus, Strain PA161109" /LENGTH=161 /DNA_ID=CAMNT_0013522433 /DNA_START=26 /DNA_END=508 /DNA_ORIENTATION=-